MFSEVRKSAYHEISLDNLTYNINVLRSRCKNPQIGIIGVVKSGAYGHGSVEIAKHLKTIGVERLAVSTLDEGIHLRKNAIDGPIHVFGNVQSWEVESCIQNRLTATVCSIGTVHEYANVFNNFINTKFVRSEETNLHFRTVNIKLDTGMSRYGCQTHELKEMVELCQKQGIEVDAIYTHFADSSSDPAFTQKQLDTFIQAIAPYRGTSIKFHVANSAASLNGVGTDLDFIRPGMALYGTPTAPILPLFKMCGIKPIGALRATPTLIKQLPTGRTVSYGMVYTTQEEEWIGTFSVGYTDGIRRKLGSNGQEIMGYVRRDSTNEMCPVIGKLAMCSIVVRLPQHTKPNESFTFISNDYEPQTSAVAIAGNEKTIANEVAIGLIGRHARVYVKDGSAPIIVHALSANSY